jgi:hypothetical protein
MEDSQAAQPDMGPPVPPVTSESSQQPATPSAEARQKAHKQKPHRPSSASASGLPFHGAPPDGTRFRVYTHVCSLCFFPFPLSLVLIHRKFTTVVDRSGRLSIWTLLQDMLCLQDHIRTVILHCGMTCMARRTPSRATHLTTLTYAMAQLNICKTTPNIYIYIRLLIGSRCRSGQAAMRGPDPHSWPNPMHPPPPHDYIPPAYDPQALMVRLRGILHPQTMREFDASCAPRCRRGTCRQQPRAPRSLGTIPRPENRHWPPPSRARTQTTLAARYVYRCCCHDYPGVGLPSRSMQCPPSRHVAPQPRGGSQL